ncbi:MAG: PAS domain-containing protein [Verrucomicrobiota bacterium]
MKVRPIPPLATARAFQCHEMFFSTTDLKGIILSGNDVFVRVSGFSREELYGRPHNIIRHPDMPRAAFALLWSNLKQGLPFAGYVKNMAKDGAYYWVFVVAVPASDGRYLSVRFKPSSPLLGQVEALYRQMLAAENAALANGGKEAEAVAAGLAVATAALESLHFASFDQLAHTALNLEIKARDAQLRAEGTRLFPAALQGARASGPAPTCMRSASRPTTRSTGCSGSSTGLSTSTGACRKSRPRCWASPRISGCTP